MYKSLSEFDVEKHLYSKERLEKSLVIYLSGENNIIINEHVTSNLEFENIVKKYLRENKKKSLIIIKTSRDAKYSKYKVFTDKLLSIFSELKNEISLELYNKKYDNLSLNEKVEFEVVYSFEVYEKEPE